MRGTRDNQRDRLKIIDVTADFSYLSQRRERACVRISVSFSPSPTVASPMKNSSLRDSVLSSWYLAGRIEKIVLPFRISRVIADSLLLVPGRS